MKDIGANESEIRDELEQVVSGPAFAASQRSIEFLRYVVEETLAGHTEQIKERSIGMAVYKRGTEYEPGADSIVRVKAAEVRKRLLRHYASNPDSRIRIEMPQGRYVPRFEVVVPPEPVPAAPQITEAVEPVASAPPKSKRWLWLAAALLVPATLVLGWFALSPAPDELDQLWRPLASSKSAVTIGLPSPTLYTVTGPPTGPIPPEAVTRISNYFVGTGAAYGAAQVAAMLTARGGRFVVKNGPDVSYEDLKNQPTVFLGAHTSAWTMEYSQKLRFQFLNLGDQTGVVDTQNPGRRWMRKSGRHGTNAAEDYAVVARLFDSNTGHPVLLIAGCGAHGTHAAAEFVSSRESFRQFTATAPADWAKRNFEVVLHAEVHNSVAGRPVVIASHVW